jgi:ubiquinone/menaquinone biosynthesis C-methylase UbiE
MVNCAPRESDKYAESAATYDRLHKEEQLRKMKLILANVEFTGGEKLLDVGCGTGFTLALWPVKEAVGAEPSHAMIAQAPPAVQARIFNVRAEDLSMFEDHEFDVVASITAIHNFTGIEDGLKEMRRVGKKKFIFTVLKKSAAFNEIDALIRKHFAVKKVLEEDQHDRIYFVG